MMMIDEVELLKRLQDARTFLNLDSPVGEGMFLGLGVAVALVRDVQRYASQEEIEKNER